MKSELIEKIIEAPSIHAQWLNTLSFKENAGARKISKCEHPTETNLMVLKHAAEEHRHAYYLKKMIDRVAPGACTTYETGEMLGAHASKHYLNKLDVFASRYFTSERFDLDRNELKYVAYLYVTYAIEVRADELYPVYHDALKAAGSQVSVYTIIKEEEGHLEEMIRSLNEFSPSWEEHAKHILAYEQELYDAWMIAVGSEVEETLAAPLN
ncbi:MAG: hypothetical protein AAF391_10930 [Bacteroidota bacterium]